MLNFLKTNRIIKALTFYTGIILGGVIFLYVLSGCTDTCESTTTYTTFNPVFATMSEIRDQVEILPPQPRENQGKIYVFGQYLFLGEPGKGIHVFNNSDKSNPIAISFINIPGNVDMAVKSGKLYADSYLDLLVFDLSDPVNILLSNRLENTFATYNTQFGIFRDGNPSRIITNYEEVGIVEVTDNCTNNSDDIMYLEGDMIAFNFDARASLSTTNTTGVGGSMARFTVVGNYLYTVDDILMQVFDVTTAESPVSLSTIDLGWGIETIFPFKNNLFIGSRSGMSIYNIDNPEAPQYVSAVAHITTCDPVVANDDFAFVTLRSENGSSWCGDSFTNQLEVIDISDIGNANRIHEFAMLSPYGLGLDGNTLFVTEGDSGLKIFDVSDVSKIDSSLLHHLTGFNAYDVIPLNGTLILTGNDGLYQFDYSNLDEIELLSLIPTSNE